MNLKSFLRTFAASMAIAAAFVVTTSGSPIRSGMTEREGSGITEREDEKNPEIARFIHENIERAGINTNPYEFLPAPETKVPKGYKPFYISHYGRHGSRSDWAGQKYPWVMEKYGKIAEEGLLTEDGERAYGRIKEIIDLHNGMDGRLTQRGQDEHRQIAGRMFAKYPQVFKKGSRKVRALSSVAQRCIISMTSFTGELLRHEPKLDITWDTGAAFQGICSTEDTREIKKAVAPVIKAQADAHVPDTAGFFRKLFKDPARAREIVGDPIQLMRYTFDVGSIAGSYYMDSRLFDMFSEEDLYWYAQNVAMNLYLRQCNSVEWGDERMKPVQELVDDIVGKADEAIATGDVAADLRFGHEYQLLAISARLGVQGVAERRSAQTSRDWAGFLYCPFACNLQMIFYKNAQNDVLVKFYLNEREAKLITLEGGPYYKWEDVKKTIETAPGLEYAL